MRGPQHAKNAVSQHLAELLPPLVDAQQLPKVQRYTTWYTPADGIEPPAWPTVNTLVMRTLPARSADDDPAGGMTYLVDYQLRVFIWVRGQGYQAVTDARDIYVGCVAGALMGWPQVDDFTVIDPRTVAAALSDVATVGARNESSIAAAYLDLVATVAETVQLQPVGTANTLTVQPHPAS